MLTSTFQRLRRLDFGDIIYTIKVKFGGLPRSRFPSLVQLIVPNFDWRRSYAVIDHPPIQVLSIGIDEKGAWFQILAILGRTLVTLRIMVYNDDHWQLVTGSLDFPLLKYLEIIPIENTIPLIIKAKTPSLRSYFIYNQILEEAFSVEVDFDVITHLYVEEPVDLNLALYPMVRHLRILFRPEIVAEMMEESPELCPRLESIEYLDKGDLVADTGPFEWEIPGRVELIPCTGDTAWEVPLPGQYPERVSTAFFLNKNK